MPIPNLDTNGELPPGVHQATIAEVEQMFGSQNERRIKLMKGLKEVVENFKAAGVSKIYIDGSFITSKPLPSDIDGCWSVLGNIDLNILNPLFWKFGSPRDKHLAKVMVKQLYGLDFYIAEHIEGGSKKSFPDFFQVSRDGRPKGIVLIYI